MLDYFITGAFIGLVSFLLHLSIILYVIYPKLVAYIAGSIHNYDFMTSPGIPFISCFFGLSNCCRIFYKKSETIVENIILEEPYPLADRFFWNYTVLLPIVTIVLWPIMVVATLFVWVISILRYRIFIKPYLQLKIVNQL